MAGIGFTLKKMFQDETYTNRSKAYLYSALVAAGPWITAVITVNILIFILEFFAARIVEEKELFMGTIVYSFVFSQIITAPWQLMITRYISDKLYTKEYKAIRPSYVGLSKIIFIFAFFTSVAFYWNRPLPILYKVMGVYLFVIISMIWILMVYLSAVKNYELIAKAYIYGGLISIVLTVFLIYRPLPFTSLVFANNILFSYLVGLSITYIMLLYNFLSTFYFGNRLEYDFLRYINRLPSLLFIGFFYTMGLWTDDIIMWFSMAGVNILNTYQYAPIYDNAVFLAYLTTIPSSVLFLVSVETEFYDTYKKYYGLVNKTGTYEEIVIAGNDMKRTIYHKLLQTFQVQALISMSLILFSKPLFRFLNFSILIRNIFRVCSLGALCNIFVLLIILVLLYYEARKRALIISFVFFVSNLVLTLFFSMKGLMYYGVGFFLGSLITLIISIFILVFFMRRINYTTFALQPLFLREETGFFVVIADLLNKFLTKVKK